MFYRDLTEDALRQQYLEEKKKLNWQTDLELHSEFLDRKVQLKVYFCTVEINSWIL